MEEIHADIKEILKMIEKGELSPSEGQTLIKEKTLKKDNSVQVSPYQAVVLSKPVKFSQVEIKPVEITEPGEYEIQILIMSFGLNFSDLLSVEGMYPNMPPYPFTPGCECSGIVRKTGRNVVDFKPGDEVICTNNITFGAHATIITIHQDYVYKKPKNITFEEISGMSLVFLVSYHALVLADIKPGDRVLIHGGAGGVGHIAIQLAKHKGARVYTTLSPTPEKIQFLRTLGVEAYIDYTTHDFREEVIRLTDGYGVDVVINTLSGDAVQKGINLIAPGGKYIEIAMVGLRTMKYFDLSQLVNNQSFHSIDIGRVMKTYPHKRREYMEIMLSMVSDRKIIPCVGKVFPFTEIREAYQYMKDRKHMGKVVVNTQLPQEFITKEITLAMEEKRTVVSSDIAIIGMSGRFPGAEDTDQLWDNLINGRDCVTEIPSNRWDINEYYHKDINRTDKINTRWGGFLSDIESFDAMFFQISGHEAAYMEPQQRIFLEEAYKALEYAGYGGTNLKGLQVGTYVGCSPGDYQDLLIQNKIPFDAQSFWGTSPAVAAARIAYYLNLKGPAITVDTACSSSLTAIYLACNDIRNGNCDMAIAGGVFLTVTPKFYLMASNAGMLSPTGRCHTFDQDADGFIPGEGAGAVILKPLNKAMEDGDPVIAVIKGIKCNQDGRTNGLTAPSSLSQNQLEEEVYNSFLINPESITYVEAHGTGTKLGDPIEIEALTKAFAKYTDKTGYCAIGSIKSNIGHTSAAAGVAGILKIALSMKHGKIPPTIHYKECNSMIDLAASPFYPADKPQPWETGGRPKRAALNSFGFSGTNVHMVLEEPPVREKEEEEKGCYVLPFSAKTEKALQDKIRQMSEWLKVNKDCYTLKEISNTLRCKRLHFNRRLVILAETMDEFSQTLNNFLMGKDISACIQDKKSFLYWEEQVLSKQNNTHVTERELLLSYLEGEETNWIAKEGYKTVPLPAYPFQKDRHWLKIENSDYKKIDTGHTDKAYQVLQNLVQGELDLEAAESLMREVFVHE